LLPAIEMVRLPVGLRDLLPEEARARKELADCVLQHFALYGYQQVTPPAFELAEVLERGLGDLDPRDVLRFVEPESGEIVALRPDVTPQIARMAATRLRHQPMPWRLAYEATVLRRRQERARKHRQIPQAGLELMGVAGPDGDLEILTVAATLLPKAGVQRFVMDIGHADVVRSLLEQYPPATQQELLDALTVKDELRVKQLALGESTVTEQIRQAVSAVASLHGDQTVIQEARRWLVGTPAETAWEQLQAVAEGCQRLGLGDVVSVDLGEVRGFAYYTGLIFHLFAPGPGEALGGGGRYDRLLSRFGIDVPAAGFAIDLDHLAWARQVSGYQTTPQLRVVVVDGPNTESVLDALRKLGIPTVKVSSAEGESYAQAWNFPALLQWHSNTSSWELRCYTDSDVVRFSQSIQNTDAVATWIQQCFYQKREESL
jgi:ATP phosphoribosyltransferase regulatory subunit